MAHRGNLCLLPLAQMVNRHKSAVLQLVIQAALRDDFGRDVQVDGMGKHLQVIRSVNWLAGSMLLGPKHKMPGDDRDSPAISTLLPDCVDCLATEI